MVVKLCILESLSTEHSSRIILSNIYKDIALIQGNSSKSNDVFYPDLLAEMPIIFSYPHIPRLDINPWANEKPLLSKTDPSLAPILHFRVRDFYSLKEVEKFFSARAGFYATEIIPCRILLVYGDEYQNQSAKLKPSDLIDLAKKYFLAVGVVFNPTPVIRSIKEELNSLEDKLSKDPDFVVSQCIYDFESSVSFLEKLNPEIYSKMFLNLGLFTNKIYFYRMGIYNPFNMPPDGEILDLVFDKKFAGVYFSSLNLKNHCSLR